ncbi:MAG: YerC/YecD family TrpR-related protein [Bacillota bacterium]|jgi:TrpR-related protein YerC/YecD|nr:YerC/YecD family TrpR-related protein [Bacillota bacterium]
MEYQSRLKDTALDFLFEGVLRLHTREECYRFFEDLCTVGELHALAQRFQVAALLHKGATYEQVERLTGMSSATIARINRFLRYGADGYRLVLSRLEAEGMATPIDTPIAPS